MKALRWQGAPAADNDALSLAMAMVAVPVVLGLVGWWVDGLLGTGPILLIAFAAFGVLCSFTSAWYRYERRIAEHEAGKPWARSSRKVPG